MVLDKIRSLREQIFLKNNINKSFFVVELTSRDEPNFTCRFECITHLTILKKIAIKRT